MIGIDEAFSAKKKQHFGNGIYKITSLSLILFVVSLPFNGIEWNLISISRFEFKITMLTFLLLFVMWLVRNQTSVIARGFRERVFCVLALMVAISQFASVINSPFPIESIKQAIIIACLLMMMIVVSETVLDKKMAEHTLTAIGALSLAIGIVGTLNYYVIKGYSGRLGQRENLPLGIIDLGGDPYYFGDILLYSIGAVFFVSERLYVRLSKKIYWRWVVPAFLMLWFSCVVITFTKGVIVATMCFFLCCILVLKKKRRFVFLHSILFMAMVVANSIVIDKPSVIKLTGGDVVSTSKVQGQNEVGEQEQVGEPKTPVRQSRKLRVSVRERVNMFDPLGINSVAIRLKAIRVSLKNSLRNIWFGNGAGVSQRLLPQMLNEYDRNADCGRRENMMVLSVYGENVNKRAIDSHVFFITEFFNVGIVGVVSLICLVAFVIAEQVRTMNESMNERGSINELLFATLVSMLVYRLCGSLIIIPSLWFMLGLSYGVTKLYRRAS